MTIQTEKVLAEALSLSPKERVTLAENILSSLDSASQKNIDDLWAREAEDRIEAFDRGEIKSTSAKAVFEKINKKYLQ